MRPERACLWLAVLLQLGVLVTPLLFQLKPLQTLLSDYQLWLILLLAAGFMAVEAESSQLAWQGAAPADASDKSAWVSSLGLLTVTLLAVAAHQAVDGAGLLAGSSLLIAGVLCRATAIRSLGHCFVSQTGLLRGHALVCDGPYRLVRHPSETGLLLIAAGMAWVAGSVPALALTVLVLLPATLWRIRREDRLLAAAFQDQFDHYRRQVPALLPLRVRAFRSPG